MPLTRRVDLATGTRVGVASETDCADGPSGDSATGYDSDFPGAGGGSGSLGTVTVSVRRTGSNPTKSGGFATLGDFTPDPFTVDGLELVEAAIWNRFSNDAFVIVLDASTLGTDPGQDHFTSCTVQQRDGSLVTYETANADDYTYSGGTDRATWQFYLPSDSLIGVTQDWGGYPALDLPESRTVSFD